MRNCHTTRITIPTGFHPHCTTPFAIPQQPAKSWLKDFIMTGGMLAIIIVIPQLLEGLLF